MPDTQKPLIIDEDEGREAKLDDGHIHQGWMIFVKGENNTSWWVPYDASGYDYARVYRDLEDAIDEVNNIVRAPTTISLKDIAIKGIWSEGVEGEILIPTAIHVTELENGRP